MKFTLEMECDNEAFEANHAMEISRILQSAIKRIKSGSDSGPLFDYDGNRVGTWRIEQ